MQSMNNLKQIGLAVHNYHASEPENALPIIEPFDSRGRQMHSWATMLLPYVERKELFESIDRELPWQDEKNAKPFSQVVGIYRAPYSGYETHDADDYALMSYAGNIRVLGPEVPKSMEGVTDGTSHTVLGGEVNEGFVAWGSPLNLRDPARGIGRAGGFGGPSKGYTVLLLLDGSVRTVDADIDPRVLRAISTPAGGENLPDDLDGVLE